MNEPPNSMAILEKLPGWLKDYYNENHPHKCLKMMSQREYIKLINRTDECSVQ